MEIAMDAPMNMAFLLREAFEMVACNLPALPFAKRISGYKMHKLSAKEKAAFDLFVHVVKRSSYNIAHWDAMYKVLTGVMGKQNTVYFRGPAGSGKSAFMRMIASFYHSSERGMCGTQALNSPFYLADLVDKEIYLCDEIQVTPENMDSIKLLLEGSDQLKTQVKFKDNRTIRRRPTIVCCNESIARFVPEALDPINQRTLEFLLKFNLPPAVGKVMYDKDIDLRNVYLHWCNWVHEEHMKSK